MPMYLGSDDAGIAPERSTLQDLPLTGWQKLSAATRGAWLESYGPTMGDWLMQKLGNDKSRKITAAEAEQMRIDGGAPRISIKPKDGQYTAGQWSEIVGRQRELTAINDVRDRTPWEMGSVVRGGAMFAAGILDPINLATALVPWTKSLSLLQGARTMAMAESALTRAGGRAIIGAADAGISTAVLEPANYAVRNALGDDYGAADSLANIAFGTAFGGGLHVVGGAVGDAFRMRAGRGEPVVTPDPMRDVQAPPAGAIVGTETKVRVGDTYEPARWTVVDAEALQATVDKADNQFRDRSRPAYQAEIQKRANALDPALVLADSPVMDIGAPTLAADGRIIGGNGRTLFITKAYEIGKGGDYRAALEARLREVGIDPAAVRDMKKPVLVRQFTREVDVKKAAMLSNEGGSTDMSPLEQAKVDSERLGDARLQAGADGNIDVPENRAAIRRWVESMPENKRNAVMDSDGMLSPEGLRRLNAALLFRAYGDSPVLGRLIEAIDPGSRNIATALGRTAPALAAMRDAIAAGDLHPLDLAGDIQQAVEKFNALRDRGTKVADYMAQLDAFGDGLSPEARLLLDFMGRNVQSPRRIMEAIQGFIDRVNEAGNPKQGDMFGAAPAPDKLALLDAAIKQAESGVETAAEVAAKVAPETREAALRAAVAQAVDGRPIDVEPIIGMDEAVGTHTLEDAMAAADRNFKPEADDLADFEFARQVEQENAQAPRWQALDAADAAAQEAEAMLDEVIAAGDQAFKYAREQAAKVEGDRRAILDAELRQAFGADTDALIASGAVEIVPTADKIPGGPHPADVKAATAPDGKVYVVAENVSPSEARGILLHEVGVHVGMEVMLGRETFDAVLGQLDQAILRGEDWAQAARAAVPADTPAHLVREEQLAYLVQNAPELPIVQRIVAAVRAWAYRTFEFARERMTLTEADFQAMAVSALRAAARDERAGAGVFAYSRGEAEDPAPAKAELKQAKASVDRARQYAKVLRAAADKLDNDAEAAAAMTAAMPDISPQEIKDLLDGLRREVKGLRGMARSANDALTAGDRAAALQTDAMKAADRLANNIEMAEVIASRNAALNQAAYLKASGFVKQFAKPGLDFEGFRALLVGSERKRAGARMSIDAEQKAFRGQWLAGLEADLRKADLWKQFTSGEFDRDAFIALHALGKGETPSVNPEALKIAEIVHKYQEHARNTRNRFGAWIRDLSGYITRQTHDMFKIREAGEKAWTEFVLPRLDVEKTLRDHGGSIEQFLQRTYEDFAAGSHMKVTAGEDDLVAFGRGANLAKRESASRVIYFKDGASAYEYNAKFGQGRLAETVLHGLDGAAKSAGLLKVLGTNPQAQLEKLFNAYADNLRTDPKRRADFLSYRKELQNLLAQVDGSANIPGNATAAKAGAFYRAWISMTRLGGMLFSSIADLPVYGSEIRFQGRGNMLSGVAEGMASLTRGRSKGERKEILAQLGVFTESTLGSVFHRFDSPDLVGGKSAAAMQLFFKLTGMNWWTESLRDGYALSHSAYMAGHTDKAWDKLPAPLRDMLGLYNVDAGKWDVLRLAALQEADGRKYLTPEGLKTVPRAAFENYIQQVGRTVSDASVQNLMDDLSSALRTMVIDRMNHAIVEPGARTRAFMLRGTQPGTVPGEMLRFVTQFKSFPIALIQMILGREVYGRGYDTIGEFVRKSSASDKLQLASFIALTTAFGYVAMSAKDLIKGKEPRPVNDPRTWLAAMQQGGGLGIYGDFLFGQYSRTGSSLSSAIAGPAFGPIDTLMDLKTRVQKGDHVAAAAFKAVIDNTPFINLFYTRMAMDYLFLYRIQESLNPGFLRRMERRAQTENGQTYWLPPSEYAVR